ncbi:MAG: DUF1846 domain-containing protein [Bacilli bacterium]|nr:DUF1846 domain-containing protein [Bacilli bacterium]
MGNSKAFNNEKYLKIQKENILKRIDLFGGRLYLEFGGKLFDDYHASRVLPGFQPDSKLQMLLTLKDQCELVIVISSNDVKNKKVRGDSGRTYDIEVERLITSFRSVGLLVQSVVLSFYEKNPEVDKFIRRLKNYKVNVYKHYKIAGYPQDIPLIVSEQGLGKNEYINVTRPLVVVTAPGPGSGKMATCLSQLYHDYNTGIKSGYAKYETFPVRNVPLSHPVNMAYEAATIDLNDVNMIDPYHLEAYNLMSVNYNRDVETFPLLKDIFVTIQKESPYNSPTDMGVNMVGFAIEDDEAVIEAAKQEVIRRFFNAKKDFLLGKIVEEAMDKIEMLIKLLYLKVEDRNCVVPALKKAEKIGSPVIAIELKDGTIITGKRSRLLTSSAATLLNALKYLAGIDDKLLLLSPSVIEPIQNLKLGALHNHSETIHAEEILIALAIQANTNPLAELCLRKLNELEDCEAHSSCLLAPVDLKTFKKLGVRMTEEATSYFYKVSLSV